MKDPWRLHQQNSFINILPQNPPRLRILHTSMQLHEDLAFWLYPSLHKVPWDESSGFNEYRENVSQHRKQGPTFPCCMLKEVFPGRDGYYAVLVSFASCMLVINVQTDRIVRTWDLVSLWLMIGLLISWNLWKPKVVNENTDDFVIIVYIGLILIRSCVCQYLFFPFVLNDMNREI